MSPLDSASLLERHKPLVRYDSQEAYFADSAAEWADNPTNELVRIDGSVVAAAAGDAHPRLSLDFLAERYEGSHPDDAIASVSEDYAPQYATLRKSGDYRNRVYGRIAEDSQGDTWLQYWFWYFYNDAGFIGFGAHEGDWENVQLRLCPHGPDVAVYAQHKEAELRPFSEVERAPDAEDRPVVYSARGSHASYFTPGKRWTGRWFDYAGGDGFCADLTMEVIDESDLGWAAWPGRWGGTRPRNPMESDSPAAPISHNQWGDPLKLHEVAKAATAYPEPQAGPPPAPAVEAKRAGEGLAVAYSLPEPAPGEPAPTSLVVHLNSPDDELPPRVHTVAIDSASGTVTLPEVVDEGKGYELKISAGNELGSGEATSGTL